MVLNLKIVNFWPRHCFYQPTKLILADFQNNESILWWFWLNSIFFGGIHFGDPWRHEMVLNWEIVEIRLVVWRYRLSMPVNLCCTNFETRKVIIWWIISVFYFLTPFQGQWRHKSVQNLKIFKIWLYHCFSRPKERTHTDFQAKNFRL